MYYPEIDVDIRLNAPKAHQRIISKLTATLGHLFYHEHEISLEPLTLSCLPRASDFYYQASSLMQSRGLKIVVTPQMQATKSTHHLNKSSKAPFTSVNLY